MDTTKLTTRTYNKIAGIYADNYSDDVTDSPYVDKFIDTLPSGANVLDVGCGPGTFSRYLAEKGFSVKGIDLSGEMIKIAREKAKMVTFAVMDMRNLKYKENTFDGLLSAYSLIHISSLEIPDVMKGFYRVLKPDGYMMIIAQAGQPERIVDEPLMKGEKIFVNFFTRLRLSTFITNAGFNVVYQEEKTMKDSEFFSNKVIYTIAKKS